MPHISEPKVTVKFQTGRHGRTDAAAKPYVVQVEKANGSCRERAYGSAGAAEKAAAKFRKELGIGEG